MTPEQQAQAWEFLTQLDRICDADIEENPGLDEYIYGFTREDMTMVFAHYDSGQITTWQIEVKPVEVDVPQYVREHLEAAAGEDHW